MLPRSLEQIDRPQGVYLEIQQRNVPGLVVRRLRRVMDNQIKALRSKKLFDRRAVANVQRGVLETPC